jgi:hypothetical protein
MTTIFMVYPPLSIQVKFAFDAPARFIGDLAVPQQLIDELALGGDQIRSELCRRRGGVGVEPA